MVLRVILLMRFFQNLQLRKCLRSTASPLCQMMRAILSKNRSVAQKRALEKKALSEELKKLQSKRQKKASEIGTELSKIDSDILDLKTKLNNI